MGDILSLVERAQETVDQDEAERVAQRLMESRFTLDDFATLMAWHDDNHLDQLKRALEGRA